VPGQFGLQRFLFGSPLRQKLAVGRQLLFSWTGQGLLWGRVQTTGVWGLAGVTLGLSGPDGCNDTATSKVLGLYWFPQLGDGPYTVTPSKTACSFDPPSQELTLADGRVRANFAANCP
jgi:hypothetical protein